MSRYNNLNTGLKIVQRMIKTYLERYPDNCPFYAEVLEDSIMGAPQPHNHSRQFLNNILWDIADSDKNPLEITPEDLQ